MTVAERLGNAARSVAILVVDIATIFTETIRVTAIKLDEWADSLKDGLKP